MRRGRGQGTAGKCLLTDEGLAPSDILVICLESHKAGNLFGDPCLTISLFFFFLDEPSSSSLLYPFDVSSLKVSGLFSQWNIKLISWVKENGFT